MADKQGEASVYKQLSADMRDGLKNIYKQISSASAGEAPVAGNTDALFTEASDQLDEVVKTTESAAMSIMEIVENQLELAQEASAIIAGMEDDFKPNERLARLDAINKRLVSDLTTVLTTLSFQDITGQRIKKVVSTLNAIEDSVVRLYLSSGLVMEGAEKDPTRDAGDLRNDAEKAMEDFREKRTSTLKGPDSNGASQKAIDDMLSQLGL